MDDTENIDWEAFAILSADPEIDVATAYAASVRDEPPKGQASRQCRVSVTAIIALLIALAVALILLAL